MSLVEQAITRMRPGGAEAAVDPAAQQQAPPPALASAAASDGAGKQLSIDLNLLRAGGYLPEQEKDRQFADHFRMIKRPLLKRALTEADAGAVDRRVLMVTSALPGDGKTFTSINLAFSIARERDVSVLLVDADLLKPHVSKIFGLHKELGLADALAEETLDIESLIVPTDTRGLSVLPAGTPSEGTSELLSSERMAQIVRSFVVSQPRRIVLLDSPPLLITSEAPTLMNVAGQVVLVVRAGQTPQRAVMDAIALIDQQKAGGLVLNEAQVGLIERYYGYGTYGSYGDAASPKS